MKSFKKYLFQLIYYLVFHISIWGIHLIVLSVIAFFHFSLGHSMTIIDDWIFSKAWRLSFISKLIGSLFIIKFLTIKSNFRNPVSSIISSGSMKLSPKVLVVTIFLALNFIFLGEPVFVLQEKFRFFNVFMSFLGPFVFFMADILLLLFLDYFYPLDFKSKILRLITFPLIFFLFSKSTYYLDKESIFLVYFSSFVLLLCFSFRSMNILNPLLLFTLIIAPLNSLFGVDIMWGNSFSPFLLKNAGDKSFWGISLSLLFFYWFFDQKKNAKKSLSD